MEGLWRPASYEPTCVSPDTSLYLLAFCFTGFGLKYWVMLPLRQLQKRRVSVQPSATDWLVEAGHLMSTSGLLEGHWV